MAPNGTSPRVFRELVEFCDGALLEAKAARPRPRTSAVQWAKTLGRSSQPTAAQGPASVSGERTPARTKLLVIAAALAVQAEWPRQHVSKASGRLPQASPAVQGEWPRRGISEEPSGQLFPTLGWPGRSGWTLPPGGTVGRTSTGPQAAQGEETACV